MIKQGPKDLLQYGHGLPFGKDHLWKAAALRTVQIELRLPNVGDIRLFDPAEEFFGRELFSQKLGSKIGQEVRIHECSIVSARQRSVNFSFPLLHPG